VIGLVYATPAEARPFLDRVGAEVAAAVATQLLISDYGAGRLLHAGICGSLTETAIAAVGALVRVDAALEAVPGELGKPLVPIGCDAGAWLDLPGLRLVTCDRPVFDSRVRRSLSTWGDIVDMEGAVVARVAALFGAPCSIIKGISDQALSGSQGELRRNIADVSDALAARLLDGLTAMTAPT
jgi:adenosylhomocysteine nucleosidase